MTRSTFSQQFRLLLWKNCILKLRRPVSSVIEILIPLAIIMILMLVRNLQLKFNMDRCYLREKYMDSLGPLPFVRDFMCTYNSTCYNQTQINWNDTSQNEFQEFLKNITSVFNSFSKTNMTLPGIIRWTNDNPLEVKKLNYSVVYITNVLSSPLKDLQALSSSGNGTAINSLNSISAFLCGSDENDIKFFYPFFISSNNTRSKRDVQSCQRTFYNTLEASIFGRQVYGSLAPVLFGKIYYTPVSNFTRELVTKANYSFVILDNLRLASIEWRVTFKAWIETQLTNNSNIENLRNFSNMCVKLNLTQISPSCSIIANLLNTASIKSIIASLSLLFSLIETLLNCVELNKFVPIENEANIDNFKESELINVFAGLVFDPSSKYLTPQNATLFNYTIRMPTNRIDSTKNSKVLDRFWTPAPRRSTLSDMKYYTSGFILLQEAVDRAFIQMVTDNNIVNIGSSIQLMPSPCYVSDKFIQFGSSLMPFFLLIAWSPTFSILVKNIVYEKEKRLKEFMLVMGLSNLVHWLAWLTISILTTLIPSVLAALILKYRQIFEFSSPGVIFLLLFSYIVSFVSQAFMLSVFFNKANIAAVVSILIYFLFYVPFLILINLQDDITYSIYFVSGLLSQVSFCNALNFVAYWEQSMEGSQFSNLYQSTVLNLNFGVGHCIIMLWVDAVLYLLITWYVEAVFPGEYGIPKPWYFFATKRYWCAGQKYQINTVSPYEIDGGENLEISDEKTKFGFEELPENLEIGISIQNLTKTFSKSSVPSVDRLNLNFYKSHITAFLGHNGAGKTTTISMLTGIFPPTSGTAYILNQDIRKDIDNIRKVLGLCPQHNILFDNLTVEDHIYFYGFLKGMTLVDIKVAIPQIAEEVGLSKKLETQSKQLSGGMKRKLCVAMAFIGGSKIIFLDEPTAGVDPFARRGIWDLLMKYRSPEKTIVLTTHHMDEADYLSDRIAIISQGKLKCSGSSVFLKRQYGEGYYLILVKNSDSQQEYFNENDHSESGKNIYQFIRKHIDNAKFVEETRTQWNFILPLEGLKNNGFSNLFQSLDDSLEKFKISTYGLSDTSLEDVFLKVADDPSSLEDQSESPTPRLNDDGDLPRLSSRSSLRDRSDFGEHEMTEQFMMERSVDYTLLSGATLLGQQIMGLEIKRFHYTKRNVKGLFAELVLPVLLVIIIVGALKMLNPFVNQPLMTIHPWLMMPKARGVNLNTFYRKENVTNALVDKLVATYRTDVGESGVRCMNSSVFVLPNRDCSASNVSAWSEEPKGVIELISPACDCNKTGYQVCSSALSGGPVSSSRTMASTDLLSNLSGYNISDHLIKKFSAYAKKLYGGYQILLPSSFGLSCKFIGQSGLWDFLNQSIARSNSSKSSPKELNFITHIKYFFQLSGSKTNFTRIWINNKGYVSMPAYANIFSNLLLRSQLNSSVDSRNYGIITSSHPFKYTQSDLINMISSQTFLEVSLSNFVILALSLIPASFVIFLIEERVCGSKRQQFVSGVNPYVYWISIFLWDIIKYLISAFLIVLIFLAFDYQSYIGPKNVGAFLTILCLYGFAIIPHMYPFSFVISTPSTAFVVLAGYNMFVGSITTITTFFLDQLQNDEPSLVPVNNILKKLFLVLPQYGLGRGMMDISFKYLQYNITNGKNDYSPFDWDICGKNLASFGILFVFWSFVVFLMESGLINKVLCNKIRNFKLKEKEIAIEEDVDVALERARIKNGTDDIDVLRVVDLTKVYNAKLRCPCDCCKKKINMIADVEKRKLAVNNICFGVKAGECFGLLGVNGAGKTTTFKMLTGEENITMGEAIINGKSTTNDMVEAHQNMGFCPQFDALHALLTCEEELYFYCRIRGIEASLIKSTVESSFTNLSISPHATKTTQTLSGGNKRKLSTAISLIGSPKVIFMDEPTSGMDAGARRFLWNTIKKLTNQHRAVVLTSHNMEECEVLCHRLAIMVNGQFQCLGSVQQLKSKFGNDYFVTMRMKSNHDDSGDRDRIKSIMEKEFTDGVSLKDENFVTLQYRMDPVQYKLYSIFEFFENLKAAEIIADYSVCQTTLDEVFINFAKKDVLKIIGTTSDPQTIPGVDKVVFVNGGFEETGNVKLSV